MLQSKKKQNKFLLAFCFGMAAAAAYLLPCWLADGGVFLYAGDFNDQQISFYTYANAFVKAGGGSFSWATDLGSSFINSYSFYLLGSPFWWLTLLLPAAWVPYSMAPMLCLKFGVAAGGAYLWIRRYTKQPNMAVVGAILYSLSGYSVYNIFFNHFIDVIALFPYMLWALDETLYNGKKGIFALFTALNLLNSYFFFVGEIVFLILYFGAKLFTGELKLTKQLFLTLAFESMLGCAMGFLLVWPAMLSLANNPRTVSLANGYRLLLYSTPQQYLAILSSLFLPPDPAYISSLCDAGTVKWTSMTVWLPLTGIAGGVAWCRSRRGAFQKLLMVCLICAFVPFLNSAFVAMNSAYYARWFYMPVLILCAVSVMAVEQADIDILHKGIIPCMIWTLSFAAFALVPVQDKETEAWSLGVVSEPVWFWVRIVFGLISLTVFALFVLQPRCVLLPRRMLACVLGVGIAFGLIHIGYGKFCQWWNNCNFKQDVYRQAQAMEWPGEEDEFFRMDTYHCYNNLSLWLNKSTVNFFNSTVAPSVMEFYPNVGVTRDVNSKPDPELYELRGLLSVKYTLVHEDSVKEFEEETWAQGWEKADVQGSYTLYENKNYIPMGFVPESYVSAEEYQDLSKSSRLGVLTKAIVLDEEQQELYGHLLTHLPEKEQRRDSYAQYEERAAALRKSACTEFAATSSGFTAKYRLEKDSLILFSVPYDEGFAGFVNGEPAEVLKVDGGLSAVFCPAGSGEVEFVYHTPGLKLSFAVSAGGVCVYALYAALLFAGSRKNRHKEKTF